jgi:toxin ParE1/3/4
MKVSFSAAAIADLAEIHDFLAKARGNPLAAKRVVGAIRQSTRRLAAFPYSGRRGDAKGTFELVVRSYPYIVVYRIHEATVQVIAVFHTSRDIPRGG